MGRNVNALYFWFRTMFGGNRKRNFSGINASEKVTPRIRGQQSNFRKNECEHVPGGLNGIVLE